MRNDDFYAQLNVSRNASKEEIQKAYKKLARQYHPDINKEAGAEERFKKINEAQSVLTDPEKRKLYDRYGSNWKEAQHHSNNNQQQWSANDRRWHGFDGNFHFDERSQSVKGEDFSDLFAHIFGSDTNGQKYQWDGYQQGPGRTVEAELEVSLADLVHGATKTISWNTMEQTGNSVRSVPQKVQFKVPKGLKNGSVIRLAGKGEKSNGQGQAGDLLLRIRVLPDERFSVQGYDLVTTIPVSPWEAALGAKVTIETVSGRINLSIPKGSYTGKKLRVKNKGLPHKKGGSGDLIVFLEVHVPKHLSSEEKTLFQELERKSRFNPRDSLGQWAAVKEI